MSSSKGEQVEQGKPPISDVAIAQMAVKVARSSFPVFAERGWKWKHGDEMLVPNEDRIAQTIQRQLLHTRGSDLDSTSSGRFTTCREEVDGKEVLTVLLELGELEGDLDV